MTCGSWGQVRLPSSKELTYPNLAKLEPWSIGWGYTKASSLYGHKIKANRPGVK